MDARRRSGARHVYTPQPGEKYTTLAHGVLLVMNRQGEPKLVWPDGRTSTLTIDRAMMILQHPDMFDEQLQNGPKSHA